MKEDRNEAYQRLHGFKPLKRTSKKQGETDWFYFDPRGARTVSDMKKINVESEISVNPMIKEILAYDMAQNPEDYYIWRTKDDDKVRSSHAARDGKIFNYNVPPEGGNPGEDYNCRCWAEPYHPNKNKQSDVAKVDLSGLPQYVGNISDDELLEKMWNNIKSFEGVISYPYIDSKGYITIGGGSNIDNYDDFMKVNFTVNGYPATDTQKLMGYNKLRDLSNQKDAYGNYINRNRTADSFLNDTNLQLSEHEAYNMARKHMTNDLAHVRKEFTDFDNFSNQLKEVLLDIQYNTGGLNKQNWPNLFKAINNRDVNGIANNVHRKDIGDNRNNWATKQIHSITNW